MITVELLKTELANVEQHHQQAMRTQLACEGGIQVLRNLIAKGEELALAAGCDTHPEFAPELQPEPAAE